MPTLNRFEVMGHAGQNAEMKFSQNGLAVLTFSLALYDGKDKQPIWVKVTAFGKTAEYNKDISKGNLIIADGRLTVEKWQGKDGIEKQSICLIANTLTNLQKWKEESKGEVAQKAPETDEIPF